jgi:2-keto-4-pentenoate hydratase
MSAAQLLVKSGAVNKAGGLGKRWGSPASDVADLIDEVHAGIEIAGSPYAGINDHGPAVTVSDFGNNIGLVVGHEIMGWREGAASTVSVFLNGRAVGRADLNDPSGGPIEAVSFLVDLAAQYGLPVARGQWISTGAIAGAHRLMPGDVFEATFGSSAPVSCRGEWASV